MNNVLIPVSIGELFDKITILELKEEKIKDVKKLLNIKKELTLLKAYSKFINVDNIQNEINELKTVNSILWDIEEKKRLKEKEKNFDNEFIELSRAVYLNNDRRAEIKYKINLITNSNIVEEKSYG